MTERAHLSVLDFCTIYEGETPAQSIARSVQLAQEAEKLGYSRMWYTEHHNMKSIMSSSPAVLIAHIGAKTERIRLGSGGVMLPNHSPYVIAEQFGTLEEMYPERIDLGVGRAPGTDMNTLGRALRRDAHSAEASPRTSRSSTPTSRASPISLGSAPFQARIPTCLSIFWARPCSAPRWRQARSALCLCLPLRPAAPRAGHHLLPRALPALRAL